MRAAALIDALGVEAFLPRAFSEFGEVFRGAVARFVGGLSAGRFAEIAGRVAGTEAGASAEERLTTFLRSCPTLHKFGQMIARRRDLSAALRVLLARLETSKGGPLPAETREMLAAELAGAREAFDLRIADSACAEASVALVVPITWRDFARGEDCEGVVKVLKPGVRERLDEELMALGEVATFLDDEAGRGRIPAIGYARAFEDVRTLLMHEVDLAGEAEHLREARGLFGDRGDVVVPEALPFCTDHLVAMSRIDGVKVTDADDLGVRREALAGTIVRRLLADVLFSPLERAVFHADPHAGNLFATRDGRLAVLDWSLIGRLGFEERRAVVELILGALYLDDARVIRGICAMAGEVGSESRLRAVVDAAVQRVFRGEFPGLGWMVLLLDGAAGCGVRFSADQLLLRKSLFLLDGVLHDLAPGFNADAVLVGAAAAAFVADWSGRTWLSADSRGRRTQLSNGDLVELAMNTPVAVMNFWARAMRGAMSGE